jgi:hypothetical protein
VPRLRTLPPALAASLALSLLAHGVVLIGPLPPASGVHGGGGASPPLVARLEHKVAAASVLAVPVTERTPAAAPEAPVPARRAPLPVPGVPAVGAPGLILPPATVSLAMDGGLEPAPAFEQVLAADHPGVLRVTLDFVEPPLPVIPAAALHDLPQRRLRALVLVRDDATVELLRTDEYDAVMIAAIREALGQARVRPGASGAVQPGWAILEFWVEPPAGVPR